MTRKRAAFVVIAIVGLLVLVLLRQKRTSGSSETAVGPATGTEPTVPSEMVTLPNRSQRTVPRASRQTAPGGSASPNLSLARMLEDAEQEKNKPVPTTQARDGYYERLLAKQGRDHAKEEQLQRNLLATFGDRPETMVGELACSSEFCRVELRGPNNIDVRESWQPDLEKALDPKGFRFMILTKDNADNTVANFYFGRDKSWTVPDFPALGIL